MVRPRSEARPSRHEESTARPRSHRHRHHHMPRLYYRQRPSNRTEVSCCVKYTVFGFNVLFWLIGLAVLLAGIYAEVVKNPFSQIGTKLYRFYLDPAWLLIILGGITFILGFSGCVGALRENTCLLAFYASIIGILLLIQLTAGILGFLFKDWVNQQLRVRLDEMIHAYRDDEDLQSVIDWIQSDWLKCCGIHGPNDWDMNIYFNKSSAALGSPEAGGVPFSCCAEQPGKALQNLFCGHNVRLDNHRGYGTIHHAGCLDAANKWINQNLVIVGGVAVGVAVIQILSICFAQSLRSDITAQRSRWFYHR